MSHVLSKLLDAVDKADSAASLTKAVQDLAAARLIDSASKLIEALSYNNPGAAVAAVDGLVQLGAPTVPALLEQLDRNNYTARAWAIRALASIGDPRGLVTLLEVATADISMSVRRAAVNGLGQIQWHQFPQQFLDIAQTEALDTLLFVAQQDEEWVVRYAGVVGLESLAISSQPGSNPRRSQIQKQFALMAHQEESPVVRARIWKAQQHFQKNTSGLTALSPMEHPSISPTDWEQIATRLCNRKLKEGTVLTEENSIENRDLVSTDVRD